MAWAIALVVLFLVWILLLSKGEKNYYKEDGRTVFKDIDNHPYQ